MKKQYAFLKMVIATMLALCLMVSAFSASAAGAWSSIAGTKSWFALPGNMEKGALKKPDIAMGSNGLSVTYKGGEYTPDGNNAGVMYGTPVSLNNFSIEFTVTKKAGDYNYQGTGIDSWISLCLLNKSDKYFNVNKAGQAQGIVTLIRPTGNTTNFEINQLTKSWANASRGSYPFAGKMTSTFTVAVKKNSDGIYDYLVNGKKVVFEGEGGIGGSNFSSSFTTLMEKGDVYLYMGVSSKSYNQNIEWRINKINGKAVKADSTGGNTTTKTTAKTTAKSTDKSTTIAGGTATTGIGETTTTDGEATTTTTQSETKDVAATTMPDTTTSGGASGKKKMSAGAVAATVVGSLAVLGGGGAGVVMLLKKKGIIKFEKRL